LLQTRKTRRHRYASVSFDIGGRFWCVFLFRFVINPTSVTAAPFVMALNFPLGQLGSRVSFAAFAGFLARAQNRYYAKHFAQPRYVWCNRQPYTTRERGGWGFSWTTLRTQLTSTSPPPPRSLAHAQCHAALPRRTAHILRWLRSPLPAPEYVVTRLRLAAAPPPPLSKAAIPRARDRARPPHPRSCVRTRAAQLSGAVRSVEWIVHASYLWLCAVAVAPHRVSHSSSLTTPYPSLPLSTEHHKRRQLH
jgi:hypothetical protein